MFFCKQRSYSRKEMGRKKRLKGRKREGLCRRKIRKKVAHAFQGKEMFGKGQTCLPKGRILGQRSMGLAHPMGHTHQWGLAQAQHWGQAWLKGEAPSRGFESKKTLVGQSKKRQSIVGQGGEGSWEPKST